MGAGMWIFWIIVIVAVVLVAKLVIDRSAQSGSSSETSLEILEKRYASGEIDQDEFERMKKQLEK